MAEEERDEHGYTGLHLAAEQGVLSQIAGGVTAKELAAARDGEGQSALQLAAVEAPWTAIVGGVPPGLLSQDELDEAFRRTVDHKLFNACDLAKLGADTRPLRDACERAQQEVLAKPQDAQKLTRLRDLLRLAADLKLTVKIEPGATAVLL